jgi:serine phosphatase RsbU (regulator of sigma subunit)
MTSEAGQCTDDAGRRLASWGVATVPMKDQAESGDTCLLRTLADGLLIAAIDGAGHGAEAASAARTAEAILAAHAEESPISLVLRCHDGLRASRGVVMTLALWHLRERTLTWVGVGNVDAVLVRAGTTGRAATERIVLRGGVVGYQLPPLRAEVIPLRPLDTLIMSTDGVHEWLADTVELTGEPQEIADRILAAHRKDTDDALVVVVRYLGPGGHDRP